MLDEGALEATLPRLREPPLALHLHEGEALWIPEGWWHQVCATPCARGTLTGHGHVTQDIGDAHERHARAQGMLKRHA